MKAAIFIEELADLMDKYDVHFVMDDRSVDSESTCLWLIQNDWEPIEIDYDWHDGKITPDSIRDIKT